MSDEDLDIHDQSESSKYKQRSVLLDRALCFDTMFYIISRSVLWRVIMSECIIVGAGGFIGAVCRYLIGLIPVKETWGFPIRTFVINIVGSFVIGIIAAAAAKNSALSPRAVLFLKTGICGGFTTFSSFALETGDLLRNGNEDTAVLYAVLSMVLSVAAVFAGQAVIGNIS